MINFSISCRLSFRSPFARRAMSWRMCLLAFSAISPAVDFMALNHGVVGEVAGFDLNGDVIVLNHDLDDRIVIRDAVVVEPDDVGGGIQFVVVAERQFGQTVVVENGHDGSHDVADVVHNYKKIDSYKFKSS